MSHTLDPRCQKANIFHRCKQKPQPQKMSQFCRTGDHWTSGVPRIVVLDVPRVLESYPLKVLDPGDALRTDSMAFFGVLSPSSIWKSPYFWE